MSTCKSSSAACQPQVHIGEGTDGGEAVQRD